MKLYIIKYNCQAIHTLFQVACHLPQHPDDIPFNGPDIRLELLQGAGWRIFIEIAVKVDFIAYFADLLVDDEVIVEIKATRVLAPEHEAQLLNYLKATDKEVGLLLNFGPKPEIRRKAFDNFRKK